jgi:hypothetical protein
MAAIVILDAGFRVQDMQVRMAWANAGARSGRIEAEAAP